MEEGNGGEEGQERGSYCLRNIGARGAKAPRAPLPFACNFWVAFLHGADSAHPLIGSSGDLVATSPRFPWGLGPGRTKYGASIRPGGSFKASWRREAAGKLLIPMPAFNSHPLHGRDEAVCQPCPGVDRVWEVPFKAVCGKML